MQIQRVERYLFNQKNRADMIQKTTFFRRLKISSCNTVSQLQKGHAPDKETNKQHQTLTNSRRLQNRALLWRLTFGTLNFEPMKNDKSERFVWDIPRKAEGT